MTKTAWGDNDTQYFFSLTPDKILNAVEAVLDIQCTGRIMPLNSMENRVYEIEIDLEEQPQNPSDNFIIGKFYRPGRWSSQQILEEHQFLADLKENEVPVIAPFKFKDGQTLAKLDDADIFFTVFPKQGGRSPDELPENDIGQIGRLLARMHNIGALKQAPERLQLNPTTYGTNNLRYLVESNVLPAEVKTLYCEKVEEICQLCEPWFAATANQRIHGDGHMGNLLQGRDGYYWVDFDDMVTGPCVQDLWLLIPGRDSYAKAQMETLINNYEIMRAFDRGSLRLIEPLRALRFIHFAAWIAKRWEDPAFPRAFPQFGTQKYWRGQLQDLAEQLQLIQSFSTTGPW